MGHHQGRWRALALSHELLGQIEGYSARRWRLGRLGLGGPAAQAVSAKVVAAMLLLPWPRYTAVGESAPPCCTPTHSLASHRSEGDAAVRVWALSDVGASPPTEAAARSGLSSLWGLVGTVEAHVNSPPANSAPNSVLANQRYY